MTQTDDNLTPAQQIDQYLAGFADWRGELAGRLRALIQAAAPELSETWKWGTPVFAHKSNVVALSIFKDHVKINFFQGAALDDSKGLFNAGLDAKTMRSIDFHQGDKINEAGLRELVQTAVAYSSSKKKK